MLATATDSVRDRSRPGWPFHLQFALLLSTGTSLTNSLHPCLTQSLSLSLALYLTLLYNVWKATNLRQVHVANAIWRTGRPTNCSIDCRLRLSLLLSFSLTLSLSLSPRLIVSLPLRKALK